MRDFELRMTRKVVTIDEYFVTVQAEDENDAEAKGEELAFEMNSDCPDGVVETNEVECQSWGVDRVRPAQTASPEKAPAL